MPRLPLLTVTKVQIPHCELEHNAKSEQSKPSAATTSRLGYIQLYSYARVVFIRKSVRQELNNNIMLYIDTEQMCTCLFSINGMLYKLHNVYICTVDKPHNHRNDKAYNVYIPFPLLLKLSWPCTSYHPPRRRQHRGHRR